jgi:hypothetical protein
VKAEVSLGPSIDPVLLEVYGFGQHAFIYEVKFAYNLSLASNPTRFSSNSIFRGLGFLMTFVGGGADSSRLNQSENSDLFAKSFSNDSLIIRAAKIRKALKGGQYYSPESSAVLSSLP